MLKIASLAMSIATATLSLSFVACDLVGAASWSTLSRPTGRATRVIITEYDLLRPTIRPYDVIVIRKEWSGIPASGNRPWESLTPKQARSRNTLCPCLNQGFPLV